MEHNNALKPGQHSSESTASAALGVLAVLCWSMDGLFTAATDSVRVTLRMSAHALVESSSAVWLLTPVFMLGVQGLVPLIILTRKQPVSAQVWKRIPWFYGTCLASGVGYAVLWLFQISL